MVFLPDRRFASYVAEELTQETYPSGRIVKTSFDTAGRAVSVGGKVTGAAYDSVTKYWPHGAPYQWALGNGIAGQSGLDQNLRITSLTAQSGSNYLHSLSYGWNNNGTLKTEGIGVNSSSATYTQTFSYDSVNRVTSISDSGGGGRNFNFDQYGNMWTTNNSGFNWNAATPSSQSSFNGANKRLTMTAATYDASGDMSAMPGNLGTVHR